MTVFVRLLHPYFVFFVVDNLASRKWYSMHQITSKQQGCQDVVFLSEIMCTAQLQARGVVSQSF